MSARITTLSQLRAGTFDLCIIGGGIVGAGLARDAVMRGLRVALIDKGDFASGASSNTSKLIHGGLRYLEHGQVRLVAESLRERHVLSKIAPALVRPLPLLLPVYAGDQRPAWKICAGLALYRLLASGRALRGPGGAALRTGLLGAQQTLLHAPRLARTGLRAAGEYSDCQMDDARLCLMNVLQAIGFGASCVNYVRLLGFGSAAGSLQRAAVEDGPTGERFEIRARVFVNAAGAWSDAVRRLSDPQAPVRLAPTKGSHVVVPRVSDHAVFAQARSDGRMIFLLPWIAGTSLIGTTESTAFKSLDELSADASEVDYLLTEARRLFPDGALAAGEVIATFAGARPLLAFGGSPTGASREHRIEVDRFGLVSVMGGKYTTYRRMAQTALDVIVSRFRLNAERCLTDSVSLIEEAPPSMLRRWQDACGRLPSERLARLLGAYGIGAFRIFELIEFDPSLAEPICGHHAMLKAEFVHQWRDELAMTLSDVLVRRSGIAFSPCHGLDALPALAGLASRYGHVPLGDVHEQIGAYHQLLSQRFGVHLDAPVAR